MVDAVTRGAEGAVLAVAERSDSSTVEDVVLLVCCRHGSFVFVGKTGLVECASAKE